MELTEAQVVELLNTIAARGNNVACERAIEQLYLEYSLLVRNFIWKTISRDSTLIDEVVQDTFMEVWKRPERFRAESKFKTWLLGVARYKALDALRKHGKEHEPLEAIEERIASVEIPVLDQIQEEQVQKAILYCLENLSLAGKLSAEHRQVLYLAYVEDQDIKEIAQVLGCVENTVKTRLHYARMRIKNCLKNQIFGGDFHG